MVALNPFLIVFLFCYSVTRFWLHL